MNLFGGEWTEKKIEIVVSYAKAYLTIMKKYQQFKCLYFDGFAGSGDIYKNDKTDIEVIKGAAIRILEIDHPKCFDLYYFVELDANNKTELEKAIVTNFANRGRNTSVVQEDCNKKLVDMAAFMRANKNFRALAFIDPYGMSLSWASIEALKGLGIDFWILVPTGIGMNRLMAKNGEIRESWFNKLESVLGLSRARIREHFYKQRSKSTLFGQETTFEKERNATEKAAALYHQRLHDIFGYVSASLPLKNSTGSVMYHFMMATNNLAACKIADDLINANR